jgi:adenine-specific DNA-methyltransferase
MPTLSFKGKNIIWNHHLSVPYHALEEVNNLHFQPEKGSGNLIIEGDNLVALKALLPQYGGQIKCIYIDPPYNTGKEDWVYSDKVNSPLIQEWLNKTVSKDDLTKHDKWLCMMIPRLKLLKELLHKNGVIFISLDNNEAFNFKQVADEIFGEDNFLGVVVVQTATDNNPTQISTEHEYIFSYAGDKECQQNWAAISEGAEKIREKYIELKGTYNTDLEAIQSDLRVWIKENKSILDKVTHYDNVDFKGVFHDGDVANTKFGGYEYEVIHPITKKACKIPEKGFRFPEITMKQLIKDDNIMFGEDETTLIKPKKRLETVTARLRSLIYEDGRAATKELEKLFGKDFFKNPKSPTILKKLFEFTTEDNDIVLDSFAGSGTTGQSVMELNHQDGGNRQFILIQMKEDSQSEPKKNICLQKTRARVEKVILEYKYNEGFRYLKVGSPIDPETMLDGELPTYNQFAEYVYYLATGNHLAERNKIDSTRQFVGLHGALAVYLIYEQDMDKLTRLALTLQMAEQITKDSPNRRRVIFAPSCFLDEEYMIAMQIEFVSVPYNLFERKYRS